MAVLKEIWMATLVHLNSDAAWVYDINNWGKLQAPASVSLVAIQSVDAQACHIKCGRVCFEIDLDRECSWTSDQSLIHFYGQLSTLSSEAIVICLDLDGRFLLVYDYCSQNLVRS